MLRDFNAKLGREDIFKPTIENKRLHQDNNDNGVRIVNFATSKNLVLKNKKFPYRNIHNTPEPFRMGRNTSRLIIH